MKRLLVLIVVAGLLGCLAAGPASAATPAPRVFTAFEPAPWGSFAEGMAADSHGNLYASITAWGYANEDYTVVEPNIGEVWEVKPDGSKKLVASMPVSAYGMLLGVAVDRCDRVYVACFDFAPDYGLPAEFGSGVFRVDRDADPTSALVKVAALPDGSFPNGIAFHRGCLYITDSSLGAVWRVRLWDGVAEPLVPWLQDDLLGPDPTSHFIIGANGLAFRGEYLYASVSDYGRIVRVKVRADGSPGTPVVVCEAPELMTADGIAFDLAGRLWITVNAGSTGGSPSGALYRLGVDGALKTIADDPGWLNYPTTPVFGTSCGTLTTLYVENGAYGSWADGTVPDVIALRVGLPGLPLW